MTETRHQRKLVLESWKFIGILHFFFYILYMEKEGRQGYTSVNLNNLMNYTIVICTISRWKVGWTGWVEFQGDRIIEV